MFELPYTTDYTLLADWVELQLTIEESHMSRSALSRRIEMLTGDFSEHLAGEVWAELERRAHAYSPERIRVVDDLVYPPQSNAITPTYVACLLFSLYGFDREHRTDPKLFERLVGEALARYLGGEVFIFGWPVMSGQSADIRQRIRELASRICEHFIEEPASTYKDRGVDVIGWRPFPEKVPDNHRGSQVVVLTQCATGANWEDKTTELPLEAWMDYLHWKSRPIKSFAVPKVIPQNRWHDISKEGGLLFDRIRIVNLIADNLSDPCLLTELTDWTNEETLGARG
jgi:hypothetical protein